MKRKLIRQDKILYTEKRKPLKEHKVELSASYLDIVGRQRTLPTSSK